MVDNAEVFKYLETVDFPASRDEIVAEAERLGAPNTVVRALRAMPPVEYGNRNEVLKSAGTELAPEVGVAERAVKARDKTHQQVSEPLRQQ
ncbi:hypothetical protein GCM10023322_81450 [Rugosimonospora acidiphila]|uniref:DUF2795 domain-containing protein n=1 Tax=Rugosimonospora acidiphila TaxID=556531 RepID=A0ABP9SRL7_9ACTN